MNETKNNSVKALKKQMAAAVAMVCVAAVALGSSTYAWFVSNNTVKGTTTNISAQSNAAFMVIDTGDTTANSGTEASYTTPEDTKLYPAKVALQTAKVSTGDAGEKGYVMQSAFASYGDKSDMKSGTLFDIAGSGDSPATIGTAAAAVQSGYAMKQTFNIGEKTGTTKLENLRVSEVKMTGTTTEKDLTTAMRILVVCDNNWIVYDASGNMKLTNITKDASNNYVLHADKFSGVGTGKQVTVDTYVYYDGDDTNVFTTNLAQLQTKHGVTLSFTADNTAKGGVKQDVTGEANAPQQ